MEILEVRNPNEVYHIFAAIPFEKRVMPSIIMIFGSSKGILLLLVNVVLMSIVISTHWIDSNKKAKIQNFSQQRTTASTISAQVGTTNQAFIPD